MISTSKLSKFFKKEAKLLGHIVTRNSIKIDPDKAKAIREWPLPKNSKGLERFLGAVNYNRSFTKEIAKLTAKLDEFKGKKGKDLSELPYRLNRAVLSCLRAGEPGAERDGMASRHAFF